MHGTFDDPSTWRKFNAILPRILITGRISWPVGQIWRRQRPDGKWEYRQDDETDHERLARNTTGF